MNPFNFLSGPVADATGWTLLHALWQGFALVLPMAVVLHLLRGRSSTLRYQIGVLTLFAQLLTSAATFAWYYEPASGVVNATISPAMMQSLSVRWQAVAQALPWHQQMQQFLQIHLSQFVLIYLIGVALFGLRLAGGWVYLQRLSRTATQPTTPKWTELTNRLRSTLAIRAVVRVRESARIAVPMVVGVLKPVLLLPIGLAANLSMREVEAVLAHELAHIKRHDYAVNLLQSVMEVLYFFHPALWWLSARVREEREHCCDDLAVLAIGGDGRILAQALARVEEMRLTQAGSTSDQPALAMAFAMKRQHLLHRVRRMLGVSTRPFVSNGSLAGLTLATMLLVSVSVYAVQKHEKQPKPKPRTTQPQPTRRHKVDGNSEYGMAGNRKVSYVIWKGQKLPADRVARLQRQLDQVMAGQLSLDAVKQPDRDILLTIIEKNSAFDSGMDGLAAGLAHIDYDNVIKTSLDAANITNMVSADINSTVQADVNSALETVEKVDYNRIVADAIASVDTNILFSEAIASYSKAQAMFDSLPSLTDESRQYQTMLRDRENQIEQNELNKGKIALLKAQAQSQGFAVEAVERKIERLERQRSVLEQKRFSETSAQQLIIMKSGFAKTDSARAASTKQIEAGEQTIQTTESAIEKLNQQLINVQTELEKAQKPLRETQAQMRKLDYSGRLSYLGYTGTGSIIRAPRPLKETKLRQLNGLVAPVAPVRPDVRATPAPPTLVIAPAPRPAVAPTPKVAPAPKPPKP